MSASLDAREWKKAMAEFARETKRDGVEAINRSMQSILYRAPYALLKKTYSQTKPGIQASVNAKYPLLIKLAAINLHKQGRDQTERSLAAAARRIMAAKYKSAGYIVSGWIPAAREFGASRVRPTSKGGKVGESHGRKATVANPEAMATNAVASIIKTPRVYALVDRQMRAAVRAETQDLVKRTQRLLAHTARKKSGRIK